MRMGNNFVSIGWIMSGAAWRIGKSVCSDAGLSWKKLEADGLTETHIWLHIGTKVCCPTLIVATGTSVQLSLFRGSWSTAELLRDSNWTGVECHGKTFLSLEKFLAYTFESTTFRTKRQLLSFWQFRIIFALVVYWFLPSILWSHRAR